MRISDWSSDVCSSDLPAKRPDAAAEQRADIGGHEARKIEGVRDTLVLRHLADVVAVIERRHTRMVKIEQIGRASRRERVCKDALISGVARSLKKHHSKNIHN